MATLVSIKILCISIVYEFTNRYRSRNKSMLFLRSWFKKAILSDFALPKTETKRIPVYIPSFSVFLVLLCDRRSSRIQFPRVHQPMRKHSCLTVNQIDHREPVCSFSNQICHLYLIKCPPRVPKFVNPPSSCGCAERLIRY
jgi:hypothetical protein